MTAAALLPHLRAARELMDRRYADPLDLNALAAAACCSRFHFVREFRAAYGETPRTYRDEHVRRGGPPPIPGCHLLMWSRPAIAEKPEAGERL